jgi:hypothetical protein
VFQTTAIVGLAPLEVAAFLGVVAFLLEGQPVALGVPGLAIVLMLIKFPTRGQVQAWLDRQRERLEAMRP